MARLASQEKALHVPTPLTIIQKIRNHLRGYGSRGIIFDPCLGTGAAAITLGKLLGENWQVYGVELDIQRAEEAQNLLGKDHVINDSFQNVHVTGNCDLLFLNPPYDDDRGERMELQFLRWSHKTLRNKGVLVYIVKDKFVDQGQYSEKTLKLLRSCGFSGVKVFKFTEPEYSDYQQIVLLAKKLEHGYISNGDMAIKGEIGWVPSGYSDYQYVQYLDLRPESQNDNDMHLARKPGKEQIVSLVAQQNWSAFETLIGSPEDAARLKPLTRLKDTNAVLVACSGLLNNAVIDNRVIKGSTFIYKAVKGKVDREDGGTEWKVVEETPTRFTILDLATNTISSIDEINNSDEYTSFLVANARQFVEACVTNYPPLYRPERHRLNFNHLNPPKKLPGREDARGALPEQEELMSAVIRGLNGHKIINIIAQMGVGKAQPLNAKILTPKGWKLMGEIKVGDKVCTPDGENSIVIGVFPQGEKDIYRVTFNDGSSTECCEDHLWAVNSPWRNWMNMPYQVKPLKKFMNNLAHKNGNRQVFIPMTKPVEFEEEHDLPLDPYLLGVLLGDGGLTANIPYLSTADQEILDSVKALLPEGVEPKYAGKYDYRLSKSNGKIGHGHTNPLTEILRDLELMGKSSCRKFIPNIYIYSSVKDRIALLQGLMDTDGHVGHNPRGSSSIPEFSTCSSELAKNVQELIQSLGGKAVIATKKTARQLSYRLHISLPYGINPFRLKRKSETFIPKTKYQPVRCVEKVEYIGRKEAQCILIDHPDHLYITDDYIVTHNTLQSIGIAYTYLVQKKWFNKKIVVLIPSTPADLANKWIGEIKTVLKDQFKAGQVWAAQAETITDIQKAFTRPGIGFIVIREYYAKADSPWLTVNAPARREKIETGVKVRNPETGQFEDESIIVKIRYCPSCLQPLTEQEKDILDTNFLKEKEAENEGKNRYSATGRKMLTCQDVYDDGNLIKKGCGNAFYTKLRADSLGKYPLARYIRNHYARQYFLIEDECFPGNTLVETINGPIPIKDVKVGDLILTEKDGELTYRKVTRTYIQPKLKPMVKVTHSHGSFICTCDHKVFVSDKKIEARHLNTGDILTHAQPTVQSLRLDSAEILEQRNRTGSPWGNLKNSRVCKVEKISITDELIYDLEVEDTHRYFANGILVSNCHEFKAGSSNRGYAAQDLISACICGIQMTGTFFNGKASGVFYMLYRSSPTFRQMYAHNELGKFVDVYGVKEQVFKEVPVRDGGSGYSGYRRIEGAPREAPGLHPSLASLILPNTVFMSKYDLDFDLAPYSEHTLYVKPDADHLIAWKSYVTKLKDKARDYYIKFTVEDMKKAMAIQAFLMYAQNGVLDLPNINDAYEPEHIYYKPPPSKGEDFLYPKEEALIRLIHREKKRGRKVLIYIHQMDKRDSSGRLTRLMERFGLRAAVLRANVKARLDFIRDNISRGVDAIITNHQLVKVGIDIVETPTVVWYSLEKQMNTLDIPQANERPHRIHQTEPVEVYYMAYNDTIQATTAQYVAKKVGVMQRFQGDVASGLAALENDTDMVDDMQSQVVTRDHFEGDISVDDLPPLPQPRGLEMTLPRVRIEKPAITIEDIHNNQVQQLAFF